MGVFGRVVENMRGFEQIRRKLYRNFMVYGVSWQSPQKEITSGNRNYFKPFSDILIMPELRFLLNEPALMIDKTLVIADLHIGIEYEYRQSGIHIPSQTPKLLERIMNIIEKHKIKRLILLGDIKHKVPGITFQEEREIPAFLKHLSEIVSVDIVPGNHDSGIKDYLPKTIHLYPSTGFGFKGYFFSHGHAWPGKKFLNNKYLLLGHIHPAIEFTDTLGYRWSELVWIQTKLKKKPIQEKYKIPIKTLPEIIIFPPFNELAGKIVVNKSLREIESQYKSGPPSPIFRVCDLVGAKIYLLDGTYLGELGKLIHC